MEPQHNTIYELLKDIDQNHILEAYEKASPQNQKALAHQLNVINQNYPGGLKHYHEKAKQLITNSANAVNPYKNYQVEIPNGINLHFTKENLEQIEHYEKKGLKQFQKTVFVLVAGGLGERLGYPGIKIEIPFELLGGTQFIRYYIEYILAFEKKFCKEGTEIPFVIMTSDDTNEKTIKILEENKNFGMKKNQITILKQQKVPAVIDNEAHFALSENKEKLQIQTKPHGHGDIHTLLYMHGQVGNWDKQGKKWIIFFQDTNPLVFRSFPAFLGVTEQKNFEFNTISINRKPGEAVGAITTLIEKETKKNLTINVEYNQLQGLFKQSGGQPVDNQGFSKYPGNTNCFVIRADRYDQILTKTKGQISQFINPKYADSTKTKLKSSARLECMMQDYPKLLDNCDRVGYTSIDKGFCFSTVKNDLATAQSKAKLGLSCESASSCQSDFYYFNRTMLRLCGAQIQEGQKHEFGGIVLPLYPMVSISPKFATCLTEMKEKVKKLKMSRHSSLILGDDCVLQDVEIDGHLELKGRKQKVISERVNDKKYKEVVDIGENESPYLKIRGYKIQ